MGKKRRQCPRGRYDGCPIPRELCTEDYESTGTWHCLQFLKDLEWFVFEGDRSEEGEMDRGGGPSEGVASIEELIRILESGE